MKSSSILDNYYSVRDFGAKGDGATDDTDALQMCFDKAQIDGATAYLPRGDYLVTRTLQIGKAENGNVAFSVVGEGRGNTRSRIIKRTDGDIAVTASQSKLEISSVCFTHHGKQGRCLYLDEKMGYGIYDCHFSNCAGNTSSMLCFTGSYADIVNSSFGNAEPEAYAIQCTTIHGKININSNIFDCRIFGPGKGLLIDSVKNNRPEGLKVSRNMFLNTGKEQITVRTILHVDISNNMMDQASGTSLLIDPEGAGVCGVYALGNYISPAKDRENGVAVQVVDNGILVLSINLSNNMIAYSGYGLIAGENVRQMIVSGNAINDITHTGVILNNTRGSIISGNAFWRCEEGDCVNTYTMDEADRPVIEHNTTGKL